MRSSKSMIPGAASHIAFTGGWLARKSPPYTVSSRCCQVESPSPFKFFAALIPPCAQTECDRFTGTIEKRSTCPPISAILMTAESPASPPPTTIIFGLAILKFFHHGDTESLRNQKKSTCFSLCLRVSVVTRFARHRIVNESISPPIGLNGCCGVFRNEYMVTAPTAINPTAMTKQTYP